MLFNRNQLHGFASFPVLLWVEWLEVCEGWLWKRRCERKRFRKVAMYLCAGFC